MLNFQLEQGQSGEESRGGHGVSDRGSRSAVWRPHPRVRRSGRIPVRPAASHTTGIRKGVAPESDTTLTGKVLEPVEVLRAGYRGRPWRRGSWSQKSQNTRLSGPGGV